MKKIILSIFILMLSLCLTSCKNDKITILSPNGTPSLSITYLEKDNKYDITYVSGSDSLSAAFINETYDFIIAPIQLGAKLYNLNNNYKMVCSLVSCNYYLVSKTNISIDSLNDKDMVLFGQSTMPDILTNYVLKNRNIKDVNISYVSSVQDASSYLLRNNNSIVLLSEPQISIIESKIGVLNKISIYEEIKDISKLSFIPQAALFVRGGVDDKTINTIKEEVKNSINNVNNNIQETKDIIDSITNEGYLKVDTTYLESIISRSNIEYVEAYLYKESFISFFNIINEYNSNLIGGIVDEKFFL